MLKSAPTLVLFGLSHLKYGFCSTERCMTSLRFSPTRHTPVKYKTRIPLSCLSMSFLNSPSSALYTTRVDLFLRVCERVSCCILCVAYQYCAWQFFGDGREFALYDILRRLVTQAKPCFTRAARRYLQLTKACHSAQVFNQKLWPFINTLS